MSKEPSPADAQAAPGPSLLTLVKALACVTVLVLLQVGAAMALFPTAEETKKIGTQLVARSGETEQEEAAGIDRGAPSSHDDATGDPHAELVEVSLGSYHVVSFNPSTGTSTAIDFELFGVILKQDETEFAERFVAHEKRMNEQVTIAIRSMQPADFEDPGLGLIKRVVLEKVNRALGKALIRETVFSQFAFMER